MTTQKLLESLSSETPCDNCPYRQACKSQHKACEKLFGFVETGEVNNNITPHPTHEWYDNIYGTGHADGKKFIVNSNTLYDLHASNGWTDKKNFIRNQIESVYTSSTGAEFLDLILPDFDDIEMYWAITRMPYVVLGGIGIQRLENAKSVVYLYVRDYYKKCGIGRMLMEKAESMSSYILLWSEEGAEKFYSRLGYKEKSGTRGLGKSTGIKGAVYYKEIPEKG